MDINRVISRLVDLTKDIIAVRNDIQDLQNNVDLEYKELFNTALYLIKECLNEISKIGFELK